MNYETGDVPWAMRDVFNKCVECGETWIGAKRAMCSKCIADNREDHTMPDERKECNADNAQ
jgi:hypothetical protein